MSLVGESEDPSIFRLGCSECQWHGEQECVLLCPKHAAVDRLIEALEPLVQYGAAFMKAFPDIDDSIGFTTDTGALRFNSADFKRARALLDELKEPTK